MPNTQETDGFQVKRAGNRNVRSTIMIALEHQVQTNDTRTCTTNFICGRLLKRCIRILIACPYASQPPQFKVDPRLAKLLGGLTQGTRQQIISALWTYIKEHRLLDATDRQFINRDKYITPVAPIFSSSIFLFLDADTRITYYCVQFSDLYYKALPANLLRTLISTVDKELSYTN